MSEFYKNEKDSVKVNPNTPVLVLTMIMSQTELTQQIYPQALSNAISEKEIVQDDRIESHSLVYLTSEDSNNNKNNKN